MYNAKDKYRKYKQEDEEFYYADVEETRSQFTKKQLSFIRKKYDIPISTKIVFAIVEQILSFLTGGKPSIQLFAQEELQKEFVLLVKRLVDSIWYENDINREFYLWLKDAIVTGSGFIHVRPNNYYQESTFGVVVEYIPWQHVFIDPYCSKLDLSDADYICIAYIMPKSKAEREYDIKINTEDNLNTLNTLEAPLSMYSQPDLSFAEALGETSLKDELKPVWIKKFYEKKKIKIYITPKGYISLEEPKPIKIPNEQKIALSMQLQNMIAIYNEPAQSPTLQQNALETEQIDEEKLQQERQQKAELAQNIQMLQEEINAMPDEIDAYAILLENGEIAIDTEYSIIKQKRVVETLLVGDVKKYEKVCPTEEFPVHHLWFAGNVNPHKTYGVVHYIKDIGHAMNKLWGLMIYDMQLRTALRVIYPNQSIVDPETAESKFAIPGAWIPYEADPDLPNAGRPEITDVPPINNYLVNAIQMLQQMSEYITGIFGVVQGNPSDAPETMGATFSLQNYGTQRVKQMSRQIEYSFAGLAYSIVKYLLRYCPKEKILQLIDPETNIDVLNINTDIKFKVRVSVSQSLPTSRQIAASALSTLAGQTQSPGVQQLLMKYMLEFMDLQEAEEIAKAMDVVSQYEQQLQIAQEELNKYKSQLDALQNNLIQKDLALEREKGIAQIKMATKAKELEIKNEALQEQEEINLYNQ